MTYTTQCHNRLIRFEDKKIEGTKKIKNVTPINVRVLVFGGGEEEELFINTNYGSS